MENIIRKRIKSLWKDSYLHGKLSVFSLIKHKPSLIMVFKAKNKKIKKIQLRNNTQCNYFYSESFSVLINRYTKIIQNINITDKNPRENVYSM